APSTPRPTLASSPAARSSTPCSTRWARAKPTCEGLRPRPPRHARARGGALSRRAGPRGEHLGAALYGRAARSPGGDGARLGLRLGGECDRQDPPEIAAAGGAVPRQRPPAGAPEKPPHTRAAADPREHRLRVLRPA